MRAINLSNIKNVLLLGEVANFKQELCILEDDFKFNVDVVNSTEELIMALANDIYHLILLDNVKGDVCIQHALEEIKVSGLPKMPLVLILDFENLEERYAYFNMGIKNFYERGHLSYLSDLINRIDKEESYRKSFMNMSIAILDDDRLQLRVLKNILDRNGVFNVDLFSHPRELVSSSNVYDIYLIDLILPEIDGEVVMHELRKHHEDPIIIGISSIEKHETIAKVLSLGANDYIVKPINEQVFMAKLYNYGKNLILKKENEMKTKVLQELASKDGLTSLYNHRYVQELLDKFVKQALRHHRPLAVIMLDIDNFKVINDQHGHPFGDAVLSAVADYLVQSVRDCDIVGRYGGEEFIIILPDTTLEQCEQVADRIQNNLSALKFKDKVQVTLSGGIGGLIKDSKQIVSDADKLLYKAKHSGKNRILSPRVKINESINKTS